jgi:hypothetical protein
MIYIDMSAKSFKDYWTIISKNPRTTFIGLLKFIILIVGLIGYFKGLGSFSEIAGGLAIFYIAIDGVGNMLSKDGGSEKEELDHFNDLKFQSMIEKGKTPIKRKSKPTTTTNVTILLLVVGLLGFSCAKKPIDTSIGQSVDSVDVSTKTKITTQDFKKIGDLAPGGSIEIRGKKITKTNDGDIEINENKKVPTIKETKTVFVPTKTVNKSKNTYNENSNNKTTDKSKTDSGNKVITKQARPLWPLLVSICMLSMAVFIIIKFKIWRLF